MISPTENGHKSESFNTNPTNLVVIQVSMFLHSDIKDHSLICYPAFLWLMFLSIVSGTGTVCIDSTPVPERYPKDTLASIAAFFCS